MYGVGGNDAITVEMVLGEAVYRSFLMLPAIAAYIFVSLSLHAIGHRRGIRGSWLAWVPIGNLWLLGSLSDQYQYLVKGKIHIRRKMLLGITVAATVLYIVCACCVLRAMELEQIAYGAAAGAILLAFITLFCVLGGLIAIIIYMYMCWYDLFRSCDPDNGVLFLVLSILCPWGLPIVVFAIRKRDGGMPPRKQPVPVAAAEAEVEPPEENAEETEKEMEGEPVDEQEIPVADA